MINLGKYIKLKPWLNRTHSVGNKLAKIVALNKLYLRNLLWQQDINTYKEYMFNVTNRLFFASVFAIFLSAFATASINSVLLHQ